MARTHARFFNKISPQQIRQREKRNYFKIYSQLKRLLDTLLYCIIGFLQFSIKSYACTVCETIESENNM